MNTWGTTTLKKVDKKSIESGFFCLLKKENKEKGKKFLKKPCNEWGLLLLYYGAVNTALSYDTRGCDTPGCTATQSVLVFLRS